MKELDSNLVKKSFLTCLVAFLTFALCSMPVKAATQKNLKNDKTYKKYDVTGDGNADTIKIKTKNNGSQCKSVKIILNGYTACILNVEDDYIYNCSATLIILDNKKPFIYMHGTGDDDDIAAYLLQYNIDTKKFDVIVNFRDLFHNTGASHAWTYIDKVKGNKIVIREQIMTYSLSTISFKMTFKYKSGTLMLDNNFELLNTWSGNTLTANKNLTAYKSASCKTKSFTIKKNQKVKIKGVALRNGNLRFKVKVNGKTGWLKALRKYPKKLCFKELQFAG